MLRHGVVCVHKQIPLYELRKKQQTEEDASDV